MKNNLFTEIMFGSNLKYELDILSLTEMKKKVMLRNLNNQKDIALTFIGKPTKKKHYKSIIAIYQQYEKELNKLLL